jgi:phosphotriesterase-related protein
VGIDRVGLEFLASDEHRADLVAGLVNEGLASQLCLSQDHSCSMSSKRAMWVPPEDRATAAARWEKVRWESTGRPHTYIVTDFLPMLIERGVPQAEVDRIFVDNPRRLLAGV